MIIRTEKSSIVIKCQTKRFQTDLVAVFIITIISNTGISILNYFPNPLAKLSMNPKMDNLFWFKIDMQDFRTCMNVIVNQSQNLTKPIRMKSAVGVPINMTILL